MLQITYKFSSIIVCSFLMGCSQQIEEKISADYMPVFHREIMLLPALLMARFTQAPLVDYLIWTKERLKLVMF